jgi:hypothetical protein
MVFRCDNFAHRKLSPDYVSKATGAELHRFHWLKEDRIGHLPAEWNWLDLEQPYNPDAKLIHFTCGIPGFAHYATSDHSLAFHKEVIAMLRCEGERAETHVSRSASLATNQP